MVAAFSNFLHPHKRRAQLQRLLKKAEEGTRKPDPDQREARQLHRRLGSAAIVEIVAAYESGSSVSQLAAAYGRSSDGMMRLLKQEGVKMRFQHLTPERVAEIVRLYEEGKSIYAIQGILAIPKTSVGRALTQAGVQMRGRGGAPRYGRLSASRCRFKSSSIRFRRRRSGVARPGYDIPWACPAIAGRGCDPHRAVLRLVRQARRRTQTVDTAEPLQATSWGCTWNRRSSSSRC